MQRPASAVIVVALSAVFLGASAPRASAQRAEKKAAISFEDAKDRYEELLRRLPFLMHTRGREELARSGDPRARDLLIQSFDRPTEPEEFVRTSLVSIVTQQFREADSLEAYARWRRRAHDDADAWLWTRTLAVQAIHDVEVVKSIALGKERAVLRAAAWEAMASTRMPQSMTMVPELLANLPKKDTDRALLVESAMACLESQQRSLSKPEVESAARSLIALLDDESLPSRTHLSMVRALGRMFNSTSLVVKADPWLRQLEAGRNPKPPKSSDHYTSFFGLQASGDRICYVIDMSDSMCKLLEGQTAKHPTGPATETGRTRRDKDKPKTDAELVSPDGLPWWKISNRFDLARAQLELSLERLGESRSFCVVWFGEDAGLLESTPGMIPANAKNIKKVAKELDAIEPGPATDMRPDGTLRGTTNLHGGLRRAFMVKSRGMVEENEYVDPVAMLEGADTLFVLSDGAPTWDDFPMKDTNYGEDRVGDPESGAAQATAGQMHYSGPYRDWERLLTDVERMNLFRKAEIHCVGIGEAQVEMLRRLAKIGNGKVQHVGNSGKAK